jgi:starch phosphorylase
MLIHNVIEKVAYCQTISVAIVYIPRQDKVGETFLDKSRWTKMSILNVARMGKFSSDRSIMDYSRKIWDVKPFPVELKWERLPRNSVLFTPLGNIKKEEV